MATSSERPSRVYGFALLGVSSSANEKSELISDIWGKRGATYGEKGACVGE